MALLVYKCYMRSKTYFCVFNSYLLGGGGVVEGGGYDNLTLPVEGSWYFITELEGVRYFC